MKKISGVLIWLMALAVCGLMVYLTLGSSFETIVFNLAVLGLMFLIIVLGWFMGFRRIGQTVKGLKKAQDVLDEVYEDRSKLGQITRADAEIFDVEYLDDKYQDYLAFLRKTNSPCDVADYIGEYEINNYIHKHMAELIPDILTSLGILGTFIGLVWGLKGFNPVSYEAMASSITSLIGGIKVAFVTSIFGIALSIAYTYSLRGSLTNISENLDAFIDKYYLCAVPPTDATAMNHILANQKENTKALRDMTGAIAERMSDSLGVSLKPVMNEISGTLQNFTDVVTLNQQALMESIAANVMMAMKKEFMAEFLEMRELLKESNKAQEGFLDFTSKAQQKLADELRECTGQIGESIKSTGDMQKDAMQQINVQQQHLSQFVDYMGQAMQTMQNMNEVNAKTLQAMQGMQEAMEVMAKESAQSAQAAAIAEREAYRAAAEAAIPTVSTRIDDIEELTERLDQMIYLMEKQQKQLTQQQKTQKKGLFR